MWIARKKGSSKVHHSDCVEARYQRKIGWMFWGGISGQYGRHKGLFWEEWRSRVTIIGRIANIPYL